MAATGRGRKTLETGAAGGSMVVLGREQVAPVTSSGSRTSGWARDVRGKTAERLFRHLSRSPFQLLTPSPAAPPAGTAATQAGLPMRQPLTKTALLAALLDGSVTIIMGEAGSGKTLQTTLMILEEYEAKGKKCCIVLVQPRRLAAESVADRLASERGEEVGQTIGLIIRGLRLTSDDTCCYVVTPGVLQSMVQSEGALRNVSHVLMDEVHERSIQQDCIIFYLGKYHSELRPELAVALLSATVPAAERDKIHQVLRHWRWGQVTAPGRLHPLHVYYLAKAKRVAGKVGGWTEGGGLSLAAGLVRALAHRHSSFLIFEPELGKLEPLKDEVERMLSNDPRLPRFVSFILHKKRRSPDHLPGGSLFQDPPANHIKIIFASAIAESSITVPDVDVVVNTGTAKENDYSHKKEAEKLTVCPCARSSADQRAGRAGRTKPGYAFHLVPPNALLPPTPRPEILRSDLRSVLVWLAAICPKTEHPSGLLLSKGFADKPEARDVQRAVAELEDMGLMDAKEKLTEQGWFAAESGLGPSEALSVLHALTLRCLRPVLWVVVMRELDAVSPCCGRSRDEDDPLRQARHATALSALSENLILFEAARDFRAVRKDEDGQARVAQQLNLDESAMRSLRGRVTRIEAKLQRMGFLAESGSKSDAPSLKTANDNCEEIVAFKACLAAGAYPRCVLMRQDGQLVSRVLGRGKVRFGGARGVLSPADVPRAAGPILLSHFTTTLPAKGGKGQLEGVDVVPGLALCLMAGPSRLQLDELREERRGWERNLPLDYRTINLGPISFRAQSNEDALQIRKLGRAYRDILLMKVVGAGTGKTLGQSLQDNMVVESVIKVLRLESQRLGLAEDADLSIAS